MTQQSAETKTVYSAETTKARLLFVVVPERADRFEIISEKLTGQALFYTFYNDEEVLIQEILPTGDWHLLGNLNDATEEQAASVVKQYTVNKWHNYENNMPFHEFCADNAIDSLKSLSHSLGFTDEQNPLVLVEFKK